MPLLQPHLLLQLLTHPSRAAHTISNCSMGRAQLIVQLPLLQHVGDPPARMPPPSWQVLGVTLAGASMCRGTITGHARTPLLLGTITTMQAAQALPAPYPKALQPQEPS